MSNKEDKEKLQELIKEDKKDKEELIKEDREKLQELIKRVKQVTENRLYDRLEKRHVVETLKSDGNVEIPTREAKNNDPPGTRTQNLCLSVKTEGQRAIWERLGYPVRIT